MTPEHENPYLTALHELLKQHSHSLQRPFKDLSARLEALELGAAKETQVQEEQTLFVQTGSGEKLWINYGQIATVVSLPSKLPAASALRNLAIKPQSAAVAIFLSQPWDTTILCQIKVKAEGTLKDQVDEDHTNYKGVDAPPGVIKAADAVASNVSTRKLGKLTPKLNLAEIAGHPVVLEISTQKMG